LSKEKKKTVFAAKESLEMIPKLVGW